MSNRYHTIVPAVRHVRSHPGGFEFDRNTTLSPGPAGDLVRRLLAPLRLPLYPASASDDSNVVDVVLDQDIPHAEGYRLIVQPERVRIVGRDLAGIGHATQVLRQLLPVAAWRAASPPSVRWTVGAGEIVDHPAMQWRGAMLDVARYFLPKQDILRYVDLLSAHRLNRLHLHLTDDQGWRIESRIHPAITEIATHRASTYRGHAAAPEGVDATPHGGYYSLADLAEIAQYAEERGIVVVPEIDVPGHCAALLAAYPHLGSAQHAVATSWGVTDGVLRPVPATLEFLRVLLDELVSALPGPYVHLGGDECVVAAWPGDPEVRDQMASLRIADPSQLHGWFMRELADHVAGAGRRALMWDEAFRTGGLRPDSIVHAWRSSEVARQAAASGYDVLHTPILPTYFDYYEEIDEREPLAIGGPVRLTDVAAFEPRPNNWTHAEAAHVLGTQFHAWGEYIPDARILDYHVFPRACTLAEVAWTGHRSGLAVDKARLTAHLERLAAAGVEYRPLDGPRPWQQGGRGWRRFRAGQARDGVDGWLAAHERLAGQGTVEISQ